MANTFASHEGRRRGTEGLLQPSFALSSPTAWLGLRNPHLLDPCPGLTAPLRLSGRDPLERMSVPFLVSSLLPFPELLTAPDRGGCVSVFTVILKAKVSR